MYYTKFELITIFALPFFEINNIIPFHKAWGEIFANKNFNMLQRDAKIACLNFLKLF